MSRHLTRDEMIDALKKMMGEQYFIRKTDHLGGRAGGIWTSGESWSDKLRTRPFDYFSDDRYRAYHPVEEFIANAGWRWEWCDPGTVLILPMPERSVAARNGEASWR